MTEPIDIIYSRVSKENETMQDLEVQEKKLIEKFNLKNPKILRERGSAYKIEALKKRKQFLRILRFAFSTQETTLDDLWLGTYTKKEIRLFVWDSHRIMRNIEYSLLFQLLSDLFGMDIYTYKDGKLKETTEETPSKKLLRYMVMGIHAYSGEEYSYTTSLNIKKAFVKGKDGLTYSRIKGKKVGGERKTDFEKVARMYKRGMKISQIARKLNINKGSVFHALRSKGLK